MKKTLAAAIVIACAAVVWFATQRDRLDEPRALEGTKLFPDLLAVVNDVDAVSVETAGESFQIASHDGIWRVTQRQGYFADIDVVRGTLVGVSEFRILEAVTSEPRHHANLELAGVGADSGSRKLILYRADESVAEVLIGKKSESRSALDEYYVRLPDDDQVWLVEGVLPESWTSREWLSATVIDLPADRVRQAVISRRDDRPVRVFRDSAETRDFSLADVPEGKQVRHQFALNDIGEVLERMEHEDIMPAGDDQWTVQFEVETFDGIIIRGRLGSGEYENYARFEAAYGAGASEARKSEADMLAQRWQGWAYRLSGSRLRTLRTTYDELVMDAGSAEQN